MTEKLSPIERVLIAASGMPAPQARSVLMLICQSGMTMPVVQPEPTEGQKHYAKREKFIRRTKSAVDRVCAYARHETLRKIEKHFRDNPPLKGAEGDPPDQGSLAARLTFKKARFSDELLAALREEGAAALTVAGQQLFDELGRDDPWTMPGDDSTAFLDARANLLARVPDEVHAEIMDEIQQGLDAGETRRQLMARIASKWDEIGTSRAETIANTETSAAFNYARDKAMREAGVTHKRWLHSMSPLIKEPRPTHLAADGQVRPIDKPFNIGGVKMMHPGDESAGPEEVINCHCVAIPVEAPIESGEGEGHPFRGNQWTHLPSFTPLPEVQQVAEKYGVNPEWKQAPRNWTSKRAQFGTIAIAPKHSADLEVQLHELAHDIWANKVTYEGKEAARRLHLWSKSLPKYIGESGWRKLPNGKLLNIYHGSKNAHEEIFAQLFALHETGQLIGDSKSAMELLLNNPKYISR